MRLKLVIDPVPHKSALVDTRTGEEVEGIHSINWGATVTGPSGEHRVQVVLSVESVETAERD